MQNSITRQIGKNVLSGRQEPNRYHSDIGYVATVCQQILSDACELGNVKVHIHDLLSEDTDLLRQIVEKY